MVLPVALSSPSAPMHVWKRVTSGVETSIMSSKRAFQVSAEALRGQALVWPVGDRCALVVQLAAALWSPATRKRAPSPECAFRS